MRNRPVICVGAVGAFGAVLAISAIAPLGPLGPLGPLERIAHADSPGTVTGTVIFEPGTVSGTVIFEGEPPERIKVRRDSDPYCAKTAQLSDDVVVSHGKLKDVLVRIKNGSLPARKMPAPPEPRPVAIDQKDCAYTPRVVGVVAGQKLVVRNSDATFHNVHGTLAGKQLWNKPAVPSSPELALDTSAHAGDVIDIACDVHPWMHAYAVVQDHMAFAVTGEDGAFVLRNVPPGKYILEAWHPTLGTRQLPIVIGVGAKAGITARLSYRRDEMPDPPGPR